MVLNPYFIGQNQIRKMINDHLESTPIKGRFRWKESYNNLRERGFFSYVGRSVLLIFLIYLIVIAIVFLLGKYVVDFNVLFGGFIERLSNWYVRRMCTVFRVNPIGIFHSWDCSQPDKGRFYSCKF